VQALIDLFFPWLIAMVVLIGCSAFFSGSEAALFSLRGGDRRAFRSGTRSQRTAAALLADPDRLLSAILFWNLVVNVAYFAMASIAGIQLQESEDAGKSAAVAFTFGSLLTIIFLSEMLPKSVAVLASGNLSALVAVPLAVAVRVVDPVMPTLRWVNLLTRRLIWPRFAPEPYLEVSDLERAIEFSTGDADLIEHERTVLHNVVSLSEIRVDAWMRPRMQFKTFRPPVALADLNGTLPKSGYVLVTEPDSDEVTGAVDLRPLADAPERHLEHLAEPVLYVPWCTTVADALQQMQTRDRKVAAVVNELGETIGILTFDDLLDTLFTLDPSRSARLTDRDAIQQEAEGVYLVSGMVGLRRLARHFDVSLPESRSATVAGVMQEILQRLPADGDRCRFGPLRFEVIEAPLRGQIRVRLTLAAEGEDAP